MIICNPQTTEEKLTEALRLLGEVAEEDNLLTISFMSEEGEIHYCYYGFRFVILTPESQLIVFCPPDLLNEFPVGLHICLAAALAEQKRREGE